MWWIIIGVYLAIAVCVYRFIRSINEDLKQRKHYEAHPERYPVSSTAGLVVCSLLWPLQLLGFVIMIFKG